MGARQEYDPGKRQFILRDLPLLVGGLALFGSSCETNPEPTETLSRLDFPEPFSLPPEPQLRVVKTKEVLQKDGYVIGVAIGKTPYGVLKLAVYYTEEEREKLLNRDAENPQVAYYDCSLSPDGKTVALAFKRAEKDNKTLNVKTVDILSGEERVFDGSLVVEGGEGLETLSDLQWSYDSNFLSSLGLGIIWDAKTGRIIYREKESYENTTSPLVNFLWSPTGNRVLISSVLFSDNIPLRIIDFNGDKRIIPLDEFQNNFYREFFRVYYTAQNGSAEWSPDGEKIAIKRFSRNQDHAIHIVDKNGGTLKNFVFNLPLRDLTWSPDSKHLAFFVDKGQDFLGSRMFEPYLILLNIETGEQIIIPTVQEAVYSLWSQPGKIFWGQNDTLFMILPDTDQGSRISPIKVTLLRADELLGGKINIRDNKLGSSQVIRLGNGFISIYNQGAPMLPRDKLVIPIQREESARPSEVLSQELYELYEVNFKTRKVEFVRKGVGLTPLTRTVEKEVIIGGEGEMIIAEGKLYRLLNGKKYLVPIPPEVFKKRSDFRGLIRVGSVQSLKDIPEGTIPTEPFILDWAGFPRRNNRGGGVKNVYVPGWLTKTESADFDVALEKTFTILRGSLERRGWREEDNLYMTYDPKRSWFGYKWQDTMRDPPESIAILSQLIKEWKESHPLDNFNLIGHSLGGLLALHAAYEHLEVINNIITIDSPLKGLPPITEKSIRESLLEFVGDRVVGFLRHAWEDEKYQGRSRRIILKAKERGTGVYTFASTDDIIVPWRSAAIEEARGTIDGQPIESVFSMGRAFKISLNPFSITDWGHGEPLGHPKILDYISKIIGQNLAAA